MEQAKNEGVHFTRLTIIYMYTVHVHCTCTLIRRWMKALGVRLASEKQVTKEIIGDNIAGEEAPFYFAMKYGIDIKPAAHVFVPDLIGKIFEVLEQNERYTYMYLYILYLADS